MSRKALGNFIRLKRLARGFRQEDVCFADPVRLNIGHYCEIERGKVVPKLQTLLDIAQVLCFEIQAVADKYLRVQTDLSELETLGLMWLEKGYLENVHKIAYRLFSLSKKKGARSAKAYVATGIFLILCCRIKEKRKGNVKLLAREMLRVMDRADIFKWLDKMYKISRESMYFEVLVEIYKATDRPKKLPKNELFSLLYQYCSALYYSGRYSDAQAVARSAYEYRSHVDKSCLRYLLIRWGNILMQQREYDDAIKRYEECIESGDPQEKDMYYFGCVSNIARAYWKKKNGDLAREYWHKILETTEPCDEARIHVLTDLCFAEITEENYAAAREYLAQSEDLINKVDGQAETAYRFKDEVALHLRNKGILSIQDKKYQEALNYLLHSALSLHGGKLEDELVTVAIPLVGIEPICSNQLTDEQRIVIRELKKRLA
ncbi:hypothetical protein I532_04125 [Brevibacillus borstelensis AK1]|uniref:DNA-binding protein n=1 Tax=Brevibacillus borstelensis AK1 TaxID=1300222 RepID=M8DMA1_9BACL|nr:transcriptional regulator [Brevibacillus borstelensis]EMT54763.1 hypothetical protein I532_04125 [Brevibacillus borstelensis AK1]